MQTKLTKITFLFCLVIPVRKTVSTICDTDAAPLEESAFICMTNMHVGCHFQ